MIREFFRKRIMPIISIVAFLIGMGIGQTFPEQDLTEPNPEIEILTSFMCTGYDGHNLPSSPTPVITPDVKGKYLCAYQQKGGEGLLTIEWQQLTGGFFSEDTYLTTDDGWFFAPLEDIEDEELSEGIYRVRVRDGRSIQSTTRFEVRKE